MEMENAMAFTGRTIALIATIAHDILATLYSIDFRLFIW